MPSAWEAHKAKWSGCTLCPLCEGRTHVVLCRGSLPCDVLFIGEAPGASEDVLGKPFVGPAGKLLDKIIESALNDRPIRVALTNLVACIPLGDDGDKVKEPSREAIESCAPRLTELRRIANPQLIVCVGDLAEKWAVKPGGGVWLIKIIHPAAILRMDASQQPLAIKRAVVAISDAVARFSE